MKFNDRQIEAIESKEGCYAVLAKAGAGKSAVVVERTARLIHSGVNPKKILIITFSNEAKENLLKRLSNKDVCVKTFHALAFSIVKIFDKNLKLWSQTWEKENCIKNLIKANRQIPCDKDLFPIYRFLSVQRFNLLEPSEAIPTSDMPFELSVMKKIYAGYIKHKEDNNLIEFDDMVFKAIEYLKKKPDVLEKIQNMSDYIMVDEFQDTSKDQIEFLKMLYGRHKNLMVVGDPSQNIYSFRGSNARYLTYFNKYFPGGKFINMNTNYRSTQEIVKFTNNIAEADSSTKTNNYEAAITPNAVGTYPYLIESYNFTSQVKKCLEAGYQYKDMFVLTRTNAELQDYETILSANEMPYKTFNNVCFLDSPEIKLVLSYIQLANDIYDNDSFIYVMNRPSRFLKKDILSQIKDKSLYLGIQTLANDNWRIKNNIYDLVDVIGELRTGDWDNVGQMIKYLRKRIDIDGFVSKTQSETDNRTESLDKFQSTCEKFSNIDKLNMFITKIRNNTKEQKDENKISLLTVHKSKGLQNKVVFVGLNEEKFPHPNCDDLESEIRLFYVACTRAEEELYLVKNGESKFLSFYQEK